MAIKPPCEAPPAGSATCVPATLAHLQLVAIVLIVLSEE
jgi:hypothetical protein